MDDNAEPYLVVVGLDGSDLSLGALEWAVNEAKLRQGAVRVVTAWHYPPVPSSVEDTAPNDAFHYSQRMQAGTLATVDSRGVDVSAVLVRDPPAKALLRAAKDAQLLVVGSRGHGGFAGLLLGSVSAQVAQHANCPVLIFRPPAKDSATR
ncbi:universal stress protein [Pseudarthrobacter enclensis]|uniref:Nucleotide-binding universal stress UspA family protein n=1 Tax=Pseudarthrobacter enclensis TaxID=993070 RepID=A0ABT9RWG3_9MICC|nr:universal stress protein [Pseudarthrobacter enclensis]MDP9889577.1 nucleotide-binding universal stress UspA family protein [Pseudarthrobacter enclensis]